MNVSVKETYLLEINLRDGVLINEFLVVDCETERDLWQAKATRIDIGHDCDAHAQRNKLKNPFQVQNEICVFDI